MNRTDAHPIELALVAGLVVIEALVVLVAAVVALVVTLARWEANHRTHVSDTDMKTHGSRESARGIRRRLVKRAAEPEPIQPQPQPQLHPLALLATELQALPVATLRQMASTRSKAIRKAQLIEMVAACS